MMFIVLQLFFIFTIYNTANHNDQLKVQCYGFYPECMRWMVTRIYNFCSLGQLAQKKQLGGSMLCRMPPLRR